MEDSVVQIVIERDSRKLSNETGISISKCAWALDYYKDYNLAKQKLLECFN